MNLDRTSIVGIVLCIVLYVSYEQYMSSKYPNRFQKTGVQTSQSHTDDKTSAVSSQQEVVSSVFASEHKKSEVKRLRTEELILENENVRYIFDQDVGGFRSIELKQYKNEDQNDYLAIVQKPLRFQGDTRGVFQQNIGPYHATRVDDNTIKFSRKSDRWLISHQIQIDPDSGYGAYIEFNWKNEDTSARDLNSYVFLAEDVILRQVKSSFIPGIRNMRQTVVVGSNQKAEWHDLPEYCKDPSKTAPMSVGTNTGVDFLGFDNHYFLKVLLPQAKTSSFSVQKLADSSHQGSCYMYIQNSLDQGLIQPGESASFVFKAWFGPKSTDAMSAFDVSLKNTLDLGFFSKISEGLFFVLKHIYRFVGNWGLAIILITVLLKIIFYPLMKLGAVSMHRMKKLQPEMNKLKERYKEDPRRQQQELMKFMSTNKVNPMKGCLPILPTIPVFFAFYQVLLTSIELRQAPFYGWIKDLAVSDPYYVTPVILGVCMVVQQKLTPTTGMDKTQEKMMMFLPVLFSFMMLTLPAGMVLYVLTNTIVSILQQQYLNKKLSTA